MAPAAVEVPVVLLHVKDSPQIRATLRGHTECVLELAFTPDGTTLASCTRKGEVKLWDTASAKEHREWQSPAWLSGLAITPDGATLATSWYKPIDKDGKALQGRFKMSDVKGYRGGIKLWDAATGKERGVLQRSWPRGVTTIALSPDGKVLAASEIWRTNDGKDRKCGIALWDVAAGKVIRDLHDKPITMVFSPDGKTLAVSNREGVLLWDVAAGRQRPKLAAEKISVVALAFAPDGKTLAGGDYKGTVYLWDVSNGTVRARLRHGDGHMVSSLAFAPHGQTLAVGLGPRNVRVIEGGEIVLWDPATREKRLTLRGHVGNVQALAFSADGSLLASGGVDKTVKLWNIAPHAASKR